MSEISNSDYALFEPVGIIDETEAISLKKRVMAAVKEGHHNLVISMQNVTFMNSSAVGTLVMLLKETRQNNGELYLCCLSDQVQVILELSRMNLVFRCFRTIAEFQQKILAKTSQ